jgi:hypothetical protein
VGHDFNVRTEKMRVEKLKPREMRSRQAEGISRLFSLPSPRHFPARTGIDETGYPAYVNSYPFPGTVETKSMIVTVDFAQPVGRVLIIASISLIG